MHPDKIIRLAADLNDVCRNLDYKWEVNSGGCCFVSAVIAKELERLGIKYKLVIYFYDYMSDNRASAVRREIKARNHGTFPSGGDTGSHYAIYIPRIKTFLNKSRFNRRDYRQMFLGRIVCDDIQWIYDTGDWNDCYDTKHNNSVRKRLKSIFKKYEKEE